MDASRKPNCNVVMIGPAPEDRAAVAEAAQQAGWRVMVMERWVPSTDHRPDVGTKCVVVDAALLRSAPCMQSELAASFPNAATIALGDEDQVVSLRQQLGVQQIHPRSAPVAGLVAAIDAWVRERQEPTNPDPPTTSMRSLMDTLSAIVILVDARGLIEHLNPAARQAFGVLSDREGRAGLVKIRWGDSNTARELEGARQRGESLRLDDIEFRNAQGAMRLLGITLNPLGNGSALLMARDITDRKREEGLYLQSRKLEAVGQLAAGVSHEINTPVQFIGDNVRFIGKCMERLLPLLDTYGSLLETAPAQTFDPAKLSALRRAQREARLKFVATQIPQSIADSLLGVEDISKIVSALRGFSDVDRQGAVEIDVNQAWRDVVTVSRAAWQAVGPVAFDLDEDLPRLQGFSGEIKQAFLHLLTNAIHATEDQVTQTGTGSGTITVRTSHLDGTLVIEVEDFGTGIPEEVKDRVFDPFFTTKALDRGSGQGLSIVRSVVEGRHAGSVEFESAKGRGTTFRVRIPFHGQVSQ